MQESNHPTAPQPRYHRELEDGGTVSLDGATVADPDTGQPVPAATLLFPAWRLRDVSRALRGWSATAALMATSADWPPDESDLATTLAVTANVLDPSHAPATPPAATPRAAPGGGADRA